MSGVREPHDDTTAPADETPQLPGFSTWRGVYWFVLGSFVAAVLLLALFTRIFAA
jgi:hypothetical protein